MRILIVGKYPPIEGGVSGQTYWLARALGELGHEVSIVTNANEVECSFRQHHYDDDTKWLKIDSVRVFHTHSLLESSFIPWAQPFVSKLFGLCMEVLHGTPCDVILGSYFEPYGVAASFAGKATGTPVFLRHAGSDIARLAHHRELNAAFRWMLDNATGMISPNVSELEVVFASAKFHQIRMPRPRLPDVFFDAVTPLDVGHVLSGADEWFGELKANAHTAAWMMNQSRRPLDDHKFTIGIYGKVGKAKGTFNLLKALERVAAQGQDFNLISLSAGHPKILSRYLEYIANSNELARRTWVMPPLAPWRVPAFLARCHAAAFLENNFSVKFHGPTVPREVIASGACLLVSEEIASNQDGKQGFADRRNVIVCQDPTNVAELSSQLIDMMRHRETTWAIGRQGKILSAAWESWLPSYRAAAEALVCQLEECLN